MRQVPLECDNNIAVNGPFLVCNLRQERSFKEMLISRSRRKHLPYLFQSVDTVPYKPYWAYCIFSKVSTKPSSPGPSWARRWPPWGRPARRSRRRRSSAGSCRRPRPPRTAPSPPPRGSWSGTRACASPRTAQPEKQTNSTRWLLWRVKASRWFSLDTFGS